MEIIFFFLACIILGVFVHFVAGNKPILERIKKIAIAQTAAPVDPNKSQRELEAAFKNLRAAKQNEHETLLGNWQDRYNSYLHVDDPEYIALQVKASGINIEEANKLVMEQNALLISQHHRVIKGHAVLRAVPSKDSTIIGTLVSGTALAVDGYVYGEKIGTTDIWFRIDDKDGVYATSFIWAGATTNPEVGDLPRVFAGPETPKSPAAERDLQREISRLNNQAANLPVSVKEMKAYRNARKGYHKQASMKEVAQALVERKAMLTAPNHTVYELETVRHEHEAIQDAFESLLKKDKVTAK